jgi:hypothetical protein
MTEPTQPTVNQAIVDVMRDVQGIRKGDKAVGGDGRQYNFRGVDAVVNAVGPVLREHGVVVVPSRMLELTVERYETKKGTAMMGVMLHAEWRWIGPAGDSITAESWGQASDAGDKAVPKAHSVAYRTMFLETLCIPTDEPDPDLENHNRAGEESQAPPSEEERRAANGGARQTRKDKPADPRAAVQAELLALAPKLGMEPPQMAAEFTQWGQGAKIQNAPVELLQAYLANLQDRIPATEEPPATEAPDPNSEEERINRAAARNAKIVGGQ